MTRCGWAGDDPLYVAYHDIEWGVPERDPRRLFEFVLLEGAQAGLSWSTILRKREGYARCFAGFDPEIVAAFGPDDEARCLADPGIVRQPGQGRLGDRATLGRGSSSTTRSPSSGTSSTVRPCRIGGPH